MVSDFLRTPASDTDKTMFFDADDGSEEHIQHAQSNKVVGATDSNRHIAKEAGTNGQASSTLPNRNSLRKNCVVDRDFAGGQTSKVSATNGNTAANDTDHFTGVGPDPFYAGKAPAPLSSNDDNYLTSTVNPRTASPTATNANGAIGGASVKRNSTITGTFAHGAGTTGPAATPDADAAQQQRKASAEERLDDSVVAKLGKGEAKEAKRLSKVIKREAQVEKKNLGAAIKELSKIQKVQKKAASEESKALSAQSSAIKTEHKYDTRFLAAKTEQEKAQAVVQARLEGLELAREYAEQQTRLLQEKTKEVEELRNLKAVDDREREAKLRDLAEVGKTRRK